MTSSISVFAFFMSFFVTSSLVFLVHRKMTAIAVRNENRQIQRQLELEKYEEAKMYMTDEEVEWIHKHEDLSKQQF
ncbi:hypothetical protein PP301_gp005 [Gordonia phage GMA2]|uniref:Uncharacterized protein n=1 Tax=Gordonia phage GMA2 TaxID=1647283 RepID=A0A0K0N715_9CAUD|nr:hypothetical protein PP301_gp005 [Gordonia phage GMA2]AKJ72543.1 hypothetical protein GMA2_5 [Gordonia phage GMA2]